MKKQSDQLRAPRHQEVKEKFDEVQIDGRYEEGMARMALYHKHCQDPVIFQALGDIRGLPLLDLACGDGFYTRRFRTRCGAKSVVGVDLSPKLIEKAQAVEQQAPLGIKYFASDVMEFESEHRFDVVTAIHLLHYLESPEEISALLRRIYQLLSSSGRFVTMIANPEFDIEKHNQKDSKEKFGYYFSLAEPGNGGIFRFHPGGFEKARELTVEFRRWERKFINTLAAEVGFRPEWYDPFISEEGLRKYGKDFFANYLANPQSKLLRLTKAG